MLICVNLVFIRHVAALICMTVHLFLYINSLENKATFFDGIKSLIALALAGSVGITLIIIACALPNNWWPLIVVLFYIFSLVPTFMSRRIVSNSFQSGSNSCQEVSIFLTMGFVISAFALPIVLAHSTVIDHGPAYLTLGGNLVIFATIFVFFVYAEQEDGFPSGF